MATEAAADVTKAIQRLWDVGSIGNRTDEELLERFLEGPDDGAEAAFAALIERHGPTVRRVCVELLGDRHEAQDAAQAAFLVLARRARSIRKPESLGAWLHGVALRLARRARGEAARRRAVERRRGEVTAERIRRAEATETELHLELHEEIDRLPEKYRGPIVLCYLQGHTQAEASRQLGWPLGTLQTRLHRARERLRTRLARRGLGAAVGTTGVLGLSEKPASATAPPLPGGWAGVTASAAVRFAARQPAANLVPEPVVHLAEKILATMLLDSWKTLALVALAVGFVGVGVGLGMRAARADRDGPAGVVEPGARVPDAVPAVVAPPPPPAPRLALRARPAAPVAVPRTWVPAVVPLVVAPPKPLRPAPRLRLRTGLDVEQAIQRGVRFLQENQKPDGSWADADSEAATGTTSLATLALVDTGAAPDSPTIARALEFLERSTPEKLRSVYAVALQTMVFAAVDPDRYKLRIAANARWLQDAQIKPGERVNWAGSWTYTARKTRNGDNSNTQYALLGLLAASDAGFAVKPEAWTLARRYWEQYQHKDGGWGYTPDNAMPTSASMTCAGIASLIITSRGPLPGREHRVGDRIEDCGKGIADVHLQRGVDWLSNHFRVNENFALGQQWRYYYLCGLERAGRLSGQRFFGAHEWYRAVADVLIRNQDEREGFWRGAGPVEGQEPVGMVSTSFALMVLARGGAPLLIQKARHAPGDDWNNDPDDIRNLVATVARDRKQLLNWHVVELDSATADDLREAPILFLNGHEAPELNDRAKQTLRAYLKGGGFLFAEACCGKNGFDQGFRALQKELFPAPESPLHALAEDHPVWGSRHPLIPANHPLWGLEIEGRTALIYSPADLSCGWNLRDRVPTDRETSRRIQVGENIVAHALAPEAGRR